MISATPPMRPPFPIETNNGPSTTSAAASDVSAQRGREADEEDCPVSPADRGIRPVRELNLDRLGGCRRLARRRGADSSYESRARRRGRHRRTRVTLELVRIGDRRQAKPSGLRRRGAPDRPRRSPAPPAAPRHSPPRTSWKSGSRRSDSPAARRLPSPLLHTRRPTSAHR
jgi:hypothetical protein